MRAKRTYYNHFTSFGANFIKSHDSMQLVQNDKITKYFGLKIQTKIFDQKQKTKQNWTREKIRYMLFVNFGHYCQKFGSGGEIWDQAVSSPNFDIIPIFPDFLRSLVLSCSTTRAQSLLQQISSPTLLVANLSFTKTQ